MEAVFTVLSVSKVSCVNNVKTGVVLNNARQIRSISPFTLQKVTLQMVVPFPKMR